MYESDTNGAGFRPSALGAAWVAAFAAAVYAYWPGLTGPFMLDDLTSIAKLGNFGGVRDWETFRAFVFRGSDGPTGRPLALLSFLVDGTNWPTDALPFKRTNLVLHLINAALLGLLTRRILGLLEFGERSARWLAFFSAAAWMLHPFLVSTTLYAVQRMAQLSMFFSIAGMLTYLHGRSLLATNARKGYVVMTISLTLFTILATLSKENGVLLPMLIGVFELTIVASRGSVLPAIDRRWLLVFIAAPSILVVTYLGYRFFSVDFLAIQRPRDFSLFERVLTQPRVVADYLQNWFFPKLYTTGVFQDHVVKSTGILSPVSTALGILLHAGLIALAVVKRRQLPLLAFGILFFYVGHLLESTTLNLEMYFEHRNYMPVAFLFLPLAVLVRDRLSRSMAAVAVVGILLVLGGFTRYSATVWSDYEIMVAVSAQKEQMSARAQSQYAVNLFNAGRRDESVQVLDRAIANIGTSRPQLLITRLIVLCNLHRLRPAELAEVGSILGPQLYDPRYLKFYTDLAQAITERRCPAVDLAHLRPMFELMLENPDNLESGSVSLSHIRYLLGYVDVKSGAREEAMRQFRASLSAHPDADSAMTMAALMATAGFGEEALSLSEEALDYVDLSTRGMRLGTDVSESDILEFREVVRADLAPGSN